MSDSSQGNEDGQVRCVCENKASYIKFIQCEECLVWQHMRCMGVDENNEPSIYYCEFCSPESHQVNERTSARTYRPDKAYTFKNKKGGSDTELPEFKKSRKSESKTSKNLKKDSKDDIKQNEEMNSPPKFTTLRGRRTNKVPYNQITEIKEIENDYKIEKPQLKTTEPIKKPQKRQYIKRKGITNNNKPKLTAEIKPALSPIKLLSPMKTHLNQPISPSFFNDIESLIIPEPILPPSTIAAPPLISKQPSPPPKPRSTHGKLSIKEAVKRANAIQGYIESFLESLNDHPNPEGVFPNSIVMAEKLLLNVKEFKDKFDN
ncbi:hypothetical protein K502DRAFT_327360 [Neoconidiobolus thromboides FSU 785]|nr:hypothetical protein K502DRAFT_327360 [Neoconidiobolus thromboides FSU 785]